MSTPVAEVNPKTAQQLSDNMQANVRTSLLTSIGSYAMLGAAASLLLAIAEYLDLSFQLTPVLDSFGERLVLAAYFSINILVGLCAGGILGLIIHLTAPLTRWLQQVISRSHEPGTLHRISTVVLIAAAAAVVLNQQHDVNGYAIALLREAEKLPNLAGRILAVEQPLSYLVVAGLLVAGWILWAAASASISWSAWKRRALIFGTLLFGAAAYYADSRLEVQQYEYSLHRAMFLVDSALSMVFVGSIYASSRRAQSIWRRLRKLIAPAILVLLVACVSFTFARFDKNQNLKTQVFYRTTQAKQHFKLVQWALDFDRDGYCSLLGGGDCNDRRADVSPGVTEQIGDGIDNNCIGGDTTVGQIEDWQRQFTPLHAVPNATPRRYNLIYFFIDTMRADHLGAYGYPRGTSPNIDRLAERSSVFVNAYSPSPYTYEAAPKFMQSAYWDGHFETWTEVLARKGYRTILFPRRLSMLLRYVKGMQQTVEAARKGLKQTIDAAIDQLGRVPADVPFCAYIYAIDPHRPYRRHQGIDFGSSVTDQYDGEIAYTDYHLGRLFDWMDKSGRINNTMVVVMSDHGESLGERMVYRHNSQVYDEQMRVPAIFYVPGMAPRRVTDYVSTIDLGPTILNLLGIDCPRQYAGVSLLPLMRGETFTHPPLYGEHDLVENSIASIEKWVAPESRKYMIITEDGYKLIYNRNFYCFELYDLKADPKEQHNLFDRMPGKAAEMRELLGRFVDVVTAKRPPDADEQKRFGNLDDDESVK